jgi:hypothetical protein
MIASISCMVVEETSPPGREAGNEEEGEGGAEGGAEGGRMLIGISSARQSLSDMGS